MAKSRGTNRVIATIMLALAAVGLLAGCARPAESERTSGVPDEYSYSNEDSRGDNDVSAPAPESDTDGGGAADSGAAPGDGTDSDSDTSGSSVQSEPAMVVESSMWIRADDAEKVTTSVESIAHKSDARIEYRDENFTDRYPNATLTIRVPAEKHDDFIAQLKEQGEVADLSTEATDVSLEKVDLESRIESLTSSLTSLRAMLEKATTVEDMLAIEREISDREAELRSLKAQHEELSGRISMSTVELRIEQAEPNPNSDSDESGDERPLFIGGLADGWNDLVAAAGALVNGLGYMFPGLALSALILAGLWFGIVRPRIRRHREQEAGDAAAHPEHAPAPTEAAAADAPSTEAALGDTDDAPAPSNPSFLGVDELQAPQLRDDADAHPAGDATAEPTAEASQTSASDDAEAPEGMPPLPGTQQK